MSQLWRLALADFGRDPRSSDSLRFEKDPKFCCCFLFRRFTVGQILRHFNTTTSIGGAV